MWMENPTTGLKWNYGMQRRCSIQCIKTGAWPGEVLWVDTLPHSHEISGWQTLSWDFVWCVKCARRTILWSQAALKKSTDAIHWTARAVRERRSRFTYRVSVLIRARAWVHSAAGYPFVCNGPRASTMTLLRSVACVWHLQWQFGKLKPHRSIHEAYYCNLTTSIKCKHNSTSRNPPWEPNTFSNSQEIPHILWNLMVHMIYLSTAIGLTGGGSVTVHTINT